MKALFFDLDGTLLTSDKTISPATTDALCRARKKGMKLYIATGRSAHLDKMLGWTDDQFSLFDGSVYCNGACLQLNGETRYTFIDPQAVRIVLEETARFPDVHLSLHGPGEAHAFNYTPPSSALGPWGLRREDIVPLDETAILSATKLLIFHDDLVNTSRVLPEALIPALRARCGHLATLYLTDRGQSIQVVSRDSGKLAGVEQVRLSLGLSKEDIAVFGDDLNDADMLAHYPCSVAMGNGAAQARAAAAFVTRSNDEDGIAYALRHLLHVI